MLATPHEFLLKNKDYTLLHIDAVIKNLNPEVLLLESRADELKIDNKADGPWPETLYANLTACSLGINVSGIDYWSPENGKPSSTYLKRDDKITENIINESKGYQRILVLIGSNHILKDIPRLKKLGYYVEKFSWNEKEKQLIMK